MTEIPVTVPLYLGPPYLLGASSHDALVHDDDLNVIGWKFKLPDDTIMMVPLVPLPD